MQEHNTTSKTIQTTRTDKGTTADDMSTGTKIDDKGLEEEVDSLGIATYELIDPPSVSYVINKGTDTQTVHTRTKLILNSVHIVE